MTNTQDSGAYWDFSDIPNSSYELSMYVFYDANYDDTDYEIRVNFKNGTSRVETFYPAEHEKEAFAIIGTFDNIQSVSIIKTKEAGAKAYVRIAAIKLVPVAEEASVVQLAARRNTTNDEINIPDVNLRNQIIETLGIKNDTITKADMRRLKKLETPNNNPEDKIRTIKGLEYATNLEELNIDYNSIKSVKYIQNLTKLKKLNISYNQIADISCLDKLTNLEEFYAINTGDTLSNYSVISNFSKLKVLNLSICNLTNIDFISDLTSLTKAYLLYNKFADNSAVRALTSATLYL